MRSITMLYASLALAMLACTSEESPTEPFGSPSLARGGGATYTAVDLNAFGGTPTFPSTCCNFASAINPAGQVVGTSEVGGGFLHAILWAKGAATDLGAGSYASDINPKGQVVGGGSPPARRYTLFCGTMES